MNFWQWLVKRCKMELDTLTGKRKTKVTSFLNILIILFWCVGIILGIIVLIKG